MASGVSGFWSELRNEGTGGTFAERTVEPTETPETRPDPRWIGARSHLRDRKTWGPAYALIRMSTPAGMLSLLSASTVFEVGSEM